MRLRTTKKMSKLGLSIMAVLVLAGVVVAATALSGCFHINQTVSAQATITMNNDITGGKLRIGNQADYQFTAALSDDMSSSIITINVHCAAGLADGQVQINAVTFDGQAIGLVPLVQLDATHYQTVITLQSSGAPSGKIVAGSFNGVLGVTYNVVGSYDLTVTVSGLVT